MERALQSLIDRYIKTGMYPAHTPEQVIGNEACRTAFLQWIKQYELNQLISNRLQWSEYNRTTVED
jgi:hypothetical protein